MQGMELIRHRRSVRTFDGNPLSGELREKVAACLAALDNPYGIPIEWKLLSAKENGLSSPVIVGADTWLAGKMKQAPHAEEAFGYEMEKLVLYAESLGLGTTWIAGTMDRGAFERAMELQEGEVMPCVTPLGVPAKRMSLRETMMRKGVKADSRAAFGELFFDGDFSKPLTPEGAGWLAEALEMVRWAPSAVNKQPWRAVVKGNLVHFYEKRTRGYVSASGWDLQKIDVGIALYHFVYGMEIQGRKAEIAAEDPGIPLPEDTQYIVSCTVGA